MSISRASRAVFCGGFLLVVVAVVSGQTGQPAPAARTQMDELLAEVRAIRADLERASAASLRGQLLGMRLQLQEQRITALARQLSEIQERLRTNAQTRVTLLSALKMFGGQNEASAEEKKAFDFAMGPVKQQLAGLDASDAELRQEEATLMAQLQQEQNRWSEFNGQIQELERASARGGR